MAWLAAMRVSVAYYYVVMAAILTVSSNVRTVVMELRVAVMCMTMYVLCTSSVAMAVRAVSTHTTRLHFRRLSCRGQVGGLAGAIGSEICFIPGWYMLICLCLVQSYVCALVGRCASNTSTWTRGSCPHLQRRASAKSQHTCVINQIHRCL